MLGTKDGTVANGKHVLIDGQQRNYSIDGINSWVLKC